MLPHPASIRIGTKLIPAHLIFFITETATTEIYTLSLHDALPIWHGHGKVRRRHRALVATGSPGAIQRSADQGCRCPAHFLPIVPAFDEKVRSVSGRWSVASGQ